MRYELPIGVLRCELHDQSKQLYSLLCLHGEVERLQGFGQLGLISRVFHGAHHPRWEYIAVTLQLIDLAKKHVNGVHLSSTVTVGDEKISKTELMKMWTLLLATGHLPWTFVAEREFLYRLKTNQRLKKQFLGALSNPEIKEAAKRIIRNEDLYHVYYLIVFYRLSSWLTRKRQKEAEEIKKRWERVLLLYIDQPNDPALLRLIDLFRRIRTISYLALDLNYVPKIVEFDLRDILLNPYKLHDFIGPHSTNGARLLKAAQNFATEEIYLHSRVISRAESPARDLRALLKKEKPQDVGLMIRKLVTGAFQNQIDTRKKDVSLVLRLSFRMDPTFAGAFFYPQTVFQEERRIDRLLDSPYAYAKISPLYDRRQKDVSIFFKRKLKTKDRIEQQGNVCNAVIDYLIEERKIVGRSDFKLPPFDVQRLIFSNPALEFVEHTLRHSGSFSGKIFFRHNPENWAPKAVVCATKAEAVRFVGEMIACLGKHGRHQNRRDELKALREAIRISSGTSFVVVLSSTYLVDEDGLDLGEIDGLFLSKYYRHFSINFVEAKRQRHRTASAIEKQLRALVDEKIKLREGLAAEFSQIQGGRALPRFQVATVDLHRSA